jgi:photosystem II stability/assembly factor-like uncharacterized protein
MRSFCLVVLATVVIADEPKGPFDGLKLRSIGPAKGGRITRVAGVAGDPLVYYAATASSGIWKSSDGGLTFKPIFENQPTATVGSIAVAPSDPNVIYAGSGEANIRGNVQPGDGIYKSTDAGKTWKKVWSQRGQIGTIAVHPRDPEIAWAAVLGHAFGPNGERGVYRSTNGGKTWEKVLFRSPDAGASDLAVDASNPRILFAGLWETRRRPWTLTSGGPGSGLFVSKDSGDTWTELSEKGLPPKPWGRVGVAVAPSDGHRVYALIEAEKGGLFRSDDGGDTWSLASDSRAIRQRAWYYTTVTVDPTNADVVWCPNVPLLKSIDGGRTFKAIRGPHHGDHHDVWIDPKNPRRMIDGNDGGVDITLDSGASWHAPPLPIAQFYHINVDNRTPYWVSGTMQDIGCAAGPSRSLNAGGISLAEWHGAGGGETGYTAHDPTDFNIIYAGEYGGILTRYDHRTRQARNVSVYPDNPSGHGADAMKYRFRWPAPMILSPHAAPAGQKTTLYHAAQVLFRSTDGGMNWSAISGDLTRNDKSKQGWSGGPITGDNTTAEFYGTISALAESPRKKGLLWVGSDDGLIHVSTDDGKTWSNVSPNVPGLPEWGTVDSLAPSPHDDNVCYAVVDAHMLDDNRPYLWKTADLGKTWKPIAAGLPEDEHLHVVKEDLKRKGLLWVGSERGLWFSPDDGGTWSRLKANLPTVAVHDLVTKDDDLVLGTNGRSIWILDDVTAIREHSAAVEDAALHLFDPKPTIAWRLAYERAWSAGENPPDGAVITYRLKRKAEADLRLEIVDSQGKVIRKFTAKPEKKEAADTEGDYYVGGDGEKPLPSEAGLHRFVWDLHHEGGKSIAGAKIDAGNPEAGPAALPGVYTVRLSLGKDLKLEKKLEVKPDPRAEVPAGDRAAQLALALQIRDDFAKIHRSVGVIRGLMVQAKVRAGALEHEPKAKDLLAKSKAFTGKLDALENRYHNPKARVVYDILAMKGGAQLYSRMGLLYDSVLSGDGAPTQGMKEMAAELRKVLEGLEAELAALLTKDLAELNAQAKAADLPTLVVPAAKPE